MRRQIASADATRTPRTARIKRRTTRRLGPPLPDWPPVEAPLLTAVGGSVPDVGEGVPAAGLVVGEGCPLGTGVGVIDGACAAAPEFGFTSSEEVSTTSKSAPGIFANCARSSLFQRSSGAPEIYQLLPLSATIIP